MDGAPANDWWIVLDADSNVQAGQGPATTLELGVIAAASLADRGERARHSVGLLARGSYTVCFKPQFCDPHRLEIMRALASLEPGHLPRSELLERASPTRGQRTSLI